MYSLTGESQNHHSNKENFITNLPIKSKRSWPGTQAPRDRPAALRRSTSALSLIAMPGYAPARTARAKPHGFCRYTRRAPGETPSAAVVSRRPAAANAPAPARCPHAPAGAQLPLSIRGARRRRIDRGFRLSRNHGGKPILRTLGLPALPAGFSGGARREADEGPRSRFGPESANPGGSLWDAPRRTWPSPGHRPEPLRKIVCCPFQSVGSRSRRREQLNPLPSETLEGPFEPAHPPANATACTQGIPLLSKRICSKFQTARDETGGGNR